MLKILIFHIYSTTSIIARSPPGKYSIDYWRFCGCTYFDHCDQGKRKAKRSRGTPDDHAGK